MLIQGVAAGMGILNLKESHRQDGRAFFKYCGKRS